MRVATFIPANCYNSAVLSNVVKDTILYFIPLLLGCSRIPAETFWFDTLTGRNGPFPPVRKTKDFRLFGGIYENFRVKFVIFSTKMLTY